MRGGAVHGRRFKAKAGLRRLYCDRFRKNFTAGHNGPVYGFLLDHLQLQDIVDVAPDRNTACGRFRCFMQAGSHESKQSFAPGMPSQWWEGGVYENEFIRENGVWKILDPQLPSRLPRLVRQGLGAYTGELRAVLLDGVSGRSARPGRVDCAEAGALARHRCGRVPLRPSGHGKALAPLNRFGTATSSAKGALSSIIVGRESHLQPIAARTLGQNLAN